jgi:hypothetical protein
MKTTHIGIVLIIAYFVGCAYVITNGLDSIKRSSYNIGCVSVPGATYQQMEQCKSQYGKERIRYERTT